jgi:hypothetical protein
MLISLQEASAATQKDPLARLEGLVLRAKTQIQNTAPRAESNQNPSRSLNFEDQNMVQVFLDGLRTPGNLDQETMPRHALDPAKVAALLDLE